MLRAMLLSGAIGVGAYTYLGDDMKLPSFETATNLVQAVAAGDAAGIAQASSEIMSVIDGLVAQAQGVTDAVLSDAEAAEPETDLAENCRQALARRDGVSAGTVMSLGDGDGSAVAGYQNPDGTVTLMTCAG